MKVHCIPIYSHVAESVIEFELNQISLCGAALFNYCIATGQNIDDALELKVGDVRNKDEITIYNYTKYCDAYTVPFTSHTKDLLNRLCGDRPDSQYLFPSIYKNMDQHMSRSGFVKQLAKALSAVNIDNADKITIYSLRKTHFLRIYQETNDIMQIRKITGHMSAARALEFIGLPVTGELENTEHSARQILLNNDYGKILIRKIQEQLFSIEKELTNPLHSDQVYSDLYNELEAFSEYLTKLFPK